MNNTQFFSRMVAGQVLLTLGGLTVASPASAEKDCTAQLASIAELYQQQNIAELDGFTPIHYQHDCQVLPHEESFTLNALVFAKAEVDELDKTHRIAVVLSNSDSGNIVAKAPTPIELEDKLWLQFKALSLDTARYWLGEGRTIEDRAFGVRMHLRSSNNVGRAERMDMFLAQGEVLRPVVTDLAVREAAGMAMPCGEEEQGTTRTVDMQPSRHNELMDLVIRSREFVTEYDFDSCEVTTVHGQRSTDILPFYAGRYRVPVQLRASDTWSYDHAFDPSRFVNSNQLANDGDFRDHLERFFGPHKDTLFWEKATLAEQIRAGLAKPEPLKELELGGYITSGCRQHSCPEKALYASDGDMLELFAALHYQCDECPDAGQLRIYYRDETALEHFGPVLSRWQGEYAPDSSVTRQAISLHGLGPVEAVNLPKDR
ncbi:hypothetical protein [Aliagarivorans taiwanensis]|uniref:hypothetical protein n=1 Tax=Aliagarivorans taiwanensis TaxID=561966 RepID=UPI000409CAFB|nr:hypothetical protein [Aliagarivorans taiwanensis]